MIDGDYFPKFLLIVVCPCTWRVNTIAALKTFITIRHSSKLGVTTKMPRGTNTTFSWHVGREMWKEQLAILLVIDGIKATNLEEHWYT